jgi:hypothetical protein
MRVYDTLVQLANPDIGISQLEDYNYTIRKVCTVKIPVYNYMLTSPTT